MVFFALATTTAPKVVFKICFANNLNHNYEHQGYRTYTSQAALRNEMGLNSSLKFESRTDHSTQTCIERDTLSCFT